MRPRTLLPLLVLAAAVVAALLLPREEEGGAEPAAGSSAASASPTADRGLESGAGESGRPVAPGAAASPASPVAAGAAAVDAPSGVRERDARGWRLAFPGAGGAEGLLHVVEVDVALQEAVLDLGFGADDLLAHPAHRTLPLLDGRADCAGLQPGVEYLAWTELPGRLSEARYLRFPLDTADWPLASAEGLRVRVLGGAGEPLAGVEVHVFASTADTGYLSLGWRERLLRKFFRWQGRTDDEGRALLDHPTAAPMAISCGEVPGLSLEVDYEAFDGEEVVLRGAPAFAVHGRVTDEDGEPVGSGFVGFLTLADGRTQEAGSARLEPDGSYACTDVSAGPSALLAAAYCDGYVMATRPVLRAAPGDELRLDFRLRRAVPVTLRLRLPDGSPAAGIRGMATRDGYDWVPGSAVSDEDGVMALAAGFAPGEACLLRWWAGQWKGEPLPFEVPADPAEVVELELPPMGWFSATSARGLPARRAEGALFEYHGARHGAERGQVWSPGEASPWLPAGPGVVQLVAADGSRVEAAVALRPGDNGALELEWAAAPLRFTLPPRADGADWELWTVDRFGSRTDAWSLPPGPQELELPVGRHVLAVDTGALRGTAVGPFELGPAGLDLGLLELGGGSLSGTVLTEAGETWDGLEVELERDDGWYGGSVRVDPDGAWAFSGLAAGRYRVSLRPGRDLLLFRADQERQVELGAGESRGGLDFVVPVAGTVEVQLSADAPRPLRGFRAGPAGLELAPVAAGGAFRVSAPAAGDWLGGFHLGLGALRIDAVAVAVPSDTRFGVGPAADERAPRLVGPAGLPLAAALVRARLAGAELPGAASTDAEGVLALATPPGLPLELLVALPGGGWERLEATSLPAGGDRVVGAAVTSCAVRCTDLAGAPLAGVTVWNPATGARRPTDAAGNARVPAAAGMERLRVELPGHWPLRVTAQPSLELVLRRRVERLLLRAPAGSAATRLVVAPDFELGEPFEPSLVETGEGWELRGFPEGDYRWWLSDAAGAPVAAGAARWTAAGPAEVELR